MQQTFANNRLVRQMLLDLIAPFLSRQSVLLLATLVGLAGLVGPFGTYDIFPPGQRLVYWAAIVLGTAGIGHAATSGLERALRRQGVPVWLELAAIAFLAAVPVCLMVALISLTFGFNPLSGHLPVLYLQCVAVLGSIAVLFHLAAPSSVADTSEGKEQRDARPLLLDRLPVAMRGRILRLSAQDHYVEVVTENGKALIAMRFRDAIAEASPEPGLQCHRSHWVALHAVAGRMRKDRRAGLVLNGGTFVPIGRTFNAAVKQALMLEQ